MRKTFARQNDAADLWIAMQRDIFTSPPGPPIVRTLEHASFSLYEFGGFVGEHQTSSYRGHIFCYVVAHSLRAKCIILTLH